MAKKLSRHTSCTSCGVDFDRGYAMNATRAANPQFCTRKCRTAYSKAKSASEVSSRFWANVNIGAADDCWEWTGRCNETGYGCFDHGGRPHVASRFCYSLTNGALPRNIFVCHRCDNPPCVNPNHLFPGTQQQNMQDAIQKGRFVGGNGRTGSQVNTSKLNEHQVRQIRASSNALKDLASTYSVSATAIRKIQLRENWGWLDA